LPALSQNRFRFNNERIKIDSLKKLLSSLKDSARIDCLNSLGDVYIVYKGNDTAQYYTALAYTESKKINYIHGMAEAKSIEAETGENFSKSIERITKLSNYMDPPQIKKDYQKHIIILVSGFGHKAGLMRHLKI
jgi:hypothetical protein